MLFKYTMTTQNLFFFSFFFVGRQNGFSAPGVSKPVDFNFIFEGQVEAQREIKKKSRTPVKNSKKGEKNFTL